MKNILILFSILLLASSCGDEFVTKTPESQIDAGIALGTTENLRTALDAAYQQLQDEDYYGKDFVLLADVMGEDIEQSVTNSNRLTLPYRWEVNANSGDAAGFWNDAYNTLLRINSVLEAMDEAEGDESEKTALKAEGLALRALVHFDLVRYFAQPYNLSDAAIAAGANGQGGHLGVPIIIAPPLPDAAPERNTVDEVYTQIVADLTESLTTWADAASDIQIRFTPNAARALLSRVYLYTEEWALAEQYATEVISSGDYTLLTTSSYVDSWDEIAPSSESIFEVAYTLAERLGTNSLGNMYHPEGYYDMLPTGDLDDLLSSISDPSTDVRAQLWDTSIPVASKFQGQAATVGYEHTPVLRLSEIYLIRSESRAELGNFDDARADLNMLRSQRIIAASETTANNSGLLQAIYDERRLELAFEGHYLWDFKRTGRSIIRDDCRLNNANCTITFPDTRMAMPIPQRELDVNSNITPNPGY